MVEVQVILLIAALTFSGLGRTSGECQRRFMFLNDTSCDDQSLFTVSVAPQKPPSMCEGYGSTSNPVTISMQATDKRYYFSISEFCFNAENVRHTVFIGITANGGKVKRRATHKDKLTCMKKTDEAFQSLNAVIHVENEKSFYTWRLRYTACETLPEEGPSNTIESRLAALEAKFKENEAKEFIGFTAILDHSRYFNEGEIIKYHRTPVNSGHYNLATGIFTCPVSGYYFFVVTAFSTQNAHLNIQIAKDSERFDGAFADKSKYDQGAGHAVVSCRSGENVFAQAVHRGDITAEAFGGKLNAFSGFFLHPSKLLSA